VETRGTGKRRKGEWSAVRRFRRGVAEEAVGGGNGGGAGVEEVVEVREEPAPRVDCGGRGYAGFDGGVAPPSGRGKERRGLKIRRKLKIGPPR
jgi:hypothetical protein